MSQRQKLISSDKLNFLSTNTLPSELWQKEILPNLGVRSLLKMQNLMPKAAHQLKGLFSSAWQALHALYFPDANRENIEWLLNRGETWFSIFMDEFFNSDLYLLDQKFPESNILDFIHCLKRNDLTSLRFLDINWSDCWQWMGESSENYQHQYYIIQLIGRSSAEMRNYVYSQLMSVANEVKEFVKEAAFIAAIACHHPLPATVPMTNGPYGYVISLNNASSSLWRSLLPIYANNLDAFPALATIDVPLHTPQQIASHLSGFAASNNCKEIFEVCLSLNPDLGRDLKKFAKLAASNGHIDLMKYIYNKYVERQSRDATVPRDEMFDFAITISNDVAAFIAFYQSYLQPCSNQENFILLQRLNISSHYALCQILDKNDPLFSERFLQFVESKKIDDSLRNIVNENLRLNDLAMFDWYYRRLQLSPVFDLAQTIISYFVATMSFRTASPKLIFKLASVLLDLNSEDNFNSNVVLRFLISSLCPLNGSNIDVNAYAKFFAWFESVLRHKNTDFTFSGFLRLFDEDTAGAIKFDMHALLAMVFEIHPEISLDQKRLPKQLQVIESLLRHPSIQQSDSLVRTKLLEAKDIAHSMTRTARTSHLGLLGTRAHVYTLRDPVSEAAEPTLGKKN